MADLAEVEAQIAEANANITAKGGAVREIKDRVKAKKKAKVHFLDPPSAAPSAQACCGGPPSLQRKRSGDLRYLPCLAAPAAGYRRQRTRLACDM